MAKAVGLQETADWEEIGHHVERDVRSGIARLVGASPDSDWGTIGQSVEQGVQKLLDGLFKPAKPATPAAPSAPAEGEADQVVDPWK
jgi:hypothetical protein